MKDPGYPQPQVEERQFKYHQIDSALKRLETQVSILADTMDELQNCQHPKEESLKDLEKSFIEVYETLVNRIEAQTDNICSIRDRIRELLI